MFLNEVLEVGAFTAISLYILVSALIAIKAKDSIYAAAALGMVGLGIAGLIAMLGYGYVAAFHVVIYVGAAVTFVTFSVLMLREQPAEFKEIKVLAALNALLLAGVYLLAIRSTGIGELGSVYLNLGEVARVIIEQYWFPLLIVFVSLATIMIEGIIVARGEEK